MTLLGVDIGQHLLAALGDSAEEITLTVRTFGSFSGSSAGGRDIVETTHACRGYRLMYQLGELGKVERAEFKLVIFAPSILTAGVAPSTRDQLDFRGSTYHIHRVDIAPTQGQYICHVGSR